MNYHLNSPSILILKILGAFFNSFQFVELFCNSNLKKFLSILIGTWNVNGQPPLQPIQQWLTHSDESPDIYAVGFQELDLSKEAFIFNDTPREEEWQ